MGIFSKMHFNKWNKSFQQQLKFIRVVLYMDLQKDFSKLSIEDEVKKVLAAQVVVYLLGGDYENTVSNSEDLVFINNFNKIKNSIKTYADEKMSKDYEVRKLIVYTLRMEMVIRCGLLGAQYLKTPDYKRRYSLLLIYGEEFKESVQPNMYQKIYEDFVLRYVELQKNNSRIL
jgi:hypothetical protein